MRSTLFAALLVATACSQPPPPPSTAAEDRTEPVWPPRDPTLDATATTTAASTATAPPTTATSAAPPTTPPGQPLPPLTDLRALLLRRQQGGPSTPECANGVVYEVELDVAKAVLVLRDCDPQPGDAPGKSKVTTRTKKLIVEQYEMIQTAYAKLERAPGGNCAADAAPITLELTSKDGAKQSFLEQSCGNPPPDVARGLSDFASKVASLAYAR